MFTSRQHDHTKRRVSSGSLIQCPGVARHAEYERPRPRSLEVGAQCQGVWGECPHLRPEAEHLVDCWRGDNSAPENGDIWEWPQKLKFLLPFKQFLRLILSTYVSIT